MNNDLTPEQTIEAIKADPKAYASIVKDQVLPELENLMTILNQSNECKEFEICLMDIQSMRDSLNDYIVEGPSAPFVKIPLEDSEIAEDHPDNMPVAVSE